MPKTPRCDALSHQLRGETYEAKCELTHLDLAGLLRSPGAGEELPRLDIRGRSPEFIRFQRRWPEGAPRHFLRPEQYRAGARRIPRGIRLPPRGPESGMPGGSGENPDYR